MPKIKGGDNLIINGVVWKVIEFRLGRGREWVYTLEMKNSSGEREKMTLNETAMEQMFAGELTTDVNLDNGNAIVGSHNSGTNINIGGRKQNV